MGSNVRLESFYNELARSGFDFNTLPADNTLRRYEQFRNDPNQRVLQPGSAQEQGPRRRVEITAFGISNAASNTVRVGISNRAQEYLNGNSGVAGDNTIYGIRPATGDSLRLVGFRPARVCLGVRLANPTEVVGTRNRVTGRAYRRRVSETYTIPFGRGSTGTEGEIERQEDIIEAAGEAHTVSFKPEHLSRRC